MAAYERFENALDQGWSEVATPTEAYVNTGSHGASTYHMTISGSSGDYYAIDPAGAGSVIYFAGWFKVVTDDMSDGSSIDIITIRNTSLGEVVTIVLTKTGTQLSVRLDIYDNGIVATAEHNISAGTWYHTAIKYANDGGPDSYEWYLSTTEDIGVAIESDASITARDPNRIRFGFCAAAGTYGADSTVIGYDSFDLDFSSMVHNAEDSAPGGSSIAAIAAAHSRRRRG